MRSRSSWVLWALAGSLTLTGTAFAQVLPRPNAGQTPNDTGKAFQFNIQRRSTSGVVKSLDAEKKTLVLETGKGKEMPIDVGPSLIKAGKGRATYEDIQVGDKISVYGESTVQGGLRAMEITLPKERMSIAPPKKVKKTKEEREAEKAAAREAKKAAKEAREAERAAKKAAKEAEKAEKEAEKKAEAEEKEADAEKEADKDAEGDKEEKEEK